MLPDPRLAVDRVGPVVVVFSREAAGADPVRKERADRGSVGRSRLTRATVKLLPGKRSGWSSRTFKSATSSVCMLSRPRLYLPALPDRRPPPLIAICSPDGPMPIRRLKNRSISPGLPTVKNPAFSRKNGRFSGKNRSNRSRLTCWSSISTCAKSVLTVASSTRLGVRLYFRSAPASGSNSVVDGPDTRLQHFAEDKRRELQLRSDGV